MAFGGSQRLQGYYFNGSVFVPTDLRSTVDGALHHYMTGGVWDYGPPREDSYIPISGSIAASSTLSATLYTSNDISAHDGTVVEIFNVTGTTPSVKAYPSYNGVLYSATPMGWVNKQTGATIDGSVGITAAGNYSLLGADKARLIELRFTATIVGGVEMRGAHWKR